ncbi:hypothetical protein AB3K78_08055 [Leucobacter sp. HNU]|uniref:hypothetical protein n=1 Tax=Leucobacter sp. HNU TaxID=3236805 RepID=UPI003A7FEFDC
MTLTVTPCTDPELWDRTVIDLGGHPLQLWGWGELKSAHRWSAERVLVTRDGETVGACQLLTRKLPWPLGGFVYAPRGPVLARGPKVAEIEGRPPGPQELRRRILHRARSPTPSPTTCAARAARWRSRSSPTRTTAGSRCPTPGVVPRPRCCRHAR